MRNWDAAYAMIEAAAIKGERCPQTAPHGPLQAGATTALARQGKIRVEIFVHNWRIATILTGEHEGKQTAAEPGGSKRPYSVTDKGGTRINGVLRALRYAGNARGPSRPGPSAPRVIHGLRDLKEGK